MLVQYFVVICIFLGDQLYRWVYLYAITGLPGAGLYPLGEEGHYGAPPSQLPPPLPGYKKRERKPKVYASYAVSHDCEAHGDIINQQSLKVQPRPARRASSYTRSSPAPARQERSYSQPRQRSASFRQPAPPPAQEGYHGRADWKGSLRSTESPARSYRAPSNSRKTSRSSQRDSVTPEPVLPARESPQDWLKMPERRSVSSEPTDWGYTTYNNFTSGKVSSSGSRTRQELSYEEDRGQRYSYNNNNSYSSSSSKVRPNYLCDSILLIECLADSWARWRGLGISQVWEASVQFSLFIC